LRARGELFQQRCRWRGQVQLPFDGPSLLHSSRRRSTEAHALSSESRSRERLPIVIGFFAAEGRDHVDFLPRANTADSDRLSLGPHRCESDFGDRVAAVRCSRALQAKQGWSVQYPGQMSRQPPPAVQVPIGSTFLRVDKTLNQFQKLVRRWAAQRTSRDLRAECGKDD
jgi:hypothetical protein